jgi:hypothetical protein
MSAPFTGRCPEDPVLLLAAFGMTDDGEEAYLDEHVRSCGRCGPRLDAIREQQASEFALSGEHIPPGIVSRWPGVRSTLAASARAAVERHLERCAECADDLAKLTRIREEAMDEGELVGALAGEDVLLRTYGSFSEPGGMRASRTMTFGRVEEGEMDTSPAPRRSRRGVLLLGGWAAFATAAAVALMLRGPVTISVPVRVAMPPDSQTAGGERILRSHSAGGMPAQTGPRAGETTPIPIPVPSWQVRVLRRDARTLPSVMRGEASAVPILERGSDPGVLVVRLDPPLSITDDTAVTLELLGTDRRVLARTRARGADFHGGGTVLLTMGGTGLPAGRYALRLRTKGSAETGGEEEVVDYPFQLTGTR